MSTEVEEIHTYSFAHACIHGDVRSTVMTRVGSAFLGRPFMWVTLGILELASHVSATYIFQ